MPLQDHFPPRSSTRGTCPGRRNTTTHPGARRQVHAWAAVRSGAADGCTRKSRQIEEAGGGARHSVEVCRHEALGQAWSGGGGSGSSRFKGPGGSQPSQFPHLNSEHTSTRQRARWTYCSNSTAYTSLRRVPRGPCCCKGRRMLRQEAGVLMKLDHATNNRRTSNQKVWRHDVNGTAINTQRRLATAVLPTSPVYRQTYHRSLQSFTDGSTVAYRRTARMPTRRDWMA